MREFFAIAVVSTTTICSFRNTSFIVFFLCNFPIIVKKPPFAVFSRYITTAIAERTPVIVDIWLFITHMGRVGIYCDISFVIMVAILNPINLSPVLCIDVVNCTRLN